MAKQQMEGKLLGLSAFQRKLLCPLGALWLALRLQRLHLLGWNNRTFDFLSHPSIHSLCYNGFCGFTVCVLCLVPLPWPCWQHSRSNKDKETYRKKKKKSHGGLCRGSRRPFRNNIFRSAIHFKATELGRLERQNRTDGTDTRE